MEPGFLSLIHESSPHFSKASNVRIEVFCQEKKLTFKNSAYGKSFADLGPEFEVPEKSQNSSCMLWDDPCE